MIIVNGVEVKQDKFGDGTLKCEASEHKRCMPYCFRKGR